MIKPIRFKEVTKVLKGENPIEDLPVYNNDEILMSCWKLSMLDRLKAIVFGKIWLQVKTKKAHPPVALICNKTGFVNIKI